MKLVKTALLLGCFQLLNCSNLYYPENTSTPANPSLGLNIAVPTAGNAWVLNNGKFTSSELITKVGVSEWSNPKNVIRTYFYAAEPGQLSVGIRAKVPSGVSKLTCHFQNDAREISLQGPGLKDVLIGNFQVDKPGYYFVDLQGLERSGPVYTDVQALLLGSSNPASIKFIKDDFYFGRRGPSVHLNFGLPSDINQVQWFYSQLTVPPNEDVIGSYFMANGFGEGYFGIQVNSATERKILFSIWSPYQTDNPSDVPEDYKIKLLKKGAGVTAGEFGNEGSGGQSFKQYNWKTGVPYGFLVGAKPTGDGSTDFTAYFFDPEANKWSLIAQFRRPKTNVYLNHLYSFIENFIPDQGVFARSCFFQNQWVYNAAGWHELTQATYTADNTARKDYRLDYSGGVNGQSFYLKNCGFFSDKVDFDTKFERKRSNIPPAINFSLLE